MEEYQHSKKARYLAAVVYLVILAVVLTGTYFSEQQKAEAKAQQSVDRLRVKASRFAEGICVTAVKFTPKQIPRTSKPAKTESNADHRKSQQE